MSEFYTHIGHLYGINSPWANAGGPVKTIEQVDAMARTEAGWVEIGSITPESRPDLSLEGQLTYIHDPNQGTTFNKFEMPGSGFGAFINDLPEMLDVAHGHRKHLIVNVAPTGADPIQETVEMVDEVYVHNADAVLVNPDCPNLGADEGGVKEQFSNNPEQLRNLLESIRGLNNLRPIFLRIAPPENRAGMGRICEVVRHSGVVSALFVSNSWPIQSSDIKEEPRLEKWSGLGGKSGPAMAFRSANVTKWAVDGLQGSGIDVVRSCGVAEFAEIDRSLRIGAVAAAGSTFYFEAGPPENWEEATDKLLSTFISGNS